MKGRRIGKKNANDKEGKGTKSIPHDSNSQKGINREEMIIHMEVLVLAKEIELN